MIFSPITSHPTKKLVLRRSMSEGNLLSVLKNTGKSKGQHHNKENHQGIVSRPSEELSDHYLVPENRLRKRSRSADSIRKFISHFGNFSQTGLPDWAEVSSSNTSLENTSTIHIDGDNNSLGK